MKAAARMKTRARRRLRAAAVAVLLGVEAPEPVRIEGTRGPTFEQAVLAAFAQAAERLARDPCIRLLSEFRDRSGRTLGTRLQERGLTAVEHLRTLVVSDGDRRAFCQSSLVLAGTRPGSGNVTFCGRRFARQQRLDPGFAAAIVIHEALHTLGLPENPPSSEEITARVLARCGR
jgi:hypothetical protein